MKLKQALNPLTFVTVTAPLLINPLTQSLVHAEQNPFEVKEIEKIRTPDMGHEGNCGEGKCGEGACGNMTLDLEGMVMNENRDRLPGDCAEISEDTEIRVAAGKQYAAPYPDTAFGFDQRQWQVKPCARITVTYTNEDDVRHQWMVHGLPAYLYPQSMFHLEANGGYSKSGTFIVPSDHKTYLVHCDMAGHMEKGMKAQLLVGNGSGDLPAIAGLSGAINPTRYDSGNNIWNWLLGMAIGIISFIIPVKYCSANSDKNKIKAQQRKQYEQTPV